MVHWEEMDMDNLDRVERIRLKQRLDSFNLVLRLGFGAVLFDSLANLFNYFRQGAWQDLAVSIGQVVTFIVLIVTTRLVRRRKLDAAGYLLILSLFFGFGVGIFFHAGISWALGGSGFLVILLMALRVLPGRTPVALLSALVFAVYVVWVELYTPVERHDLRGSGTFMLFIIVLVLLLAAFGIWQFVRLLRFGTIRRRLLVIFVALVLLPALAVGAVSSLIGAQRLLDQAKSQLVSIATLKEVEILAWTDSLKSYLALSMPNSDQMLFYELLIGGPAGPDTALYRNTYDRELRRYRSIIEQSDVFTEIFVLAPDGVVRLSTNPAQIGRNQYGYTFLEQGLKGYFVSPPYFDALLGKVTVVVAAPLVDDGGKTIGVLAARANLDQLNSIMGEYAGLGQTGETYLVGMRSRILMTETRFAERGLMVGNYISASEGITQAILAQRDVAGTYTNYYGQQVVGAYRLLEELDLVLVAEQEQAEVLRGVVQNVAVNVAVTLGAILVAVVLGLVVTNRITTPIARLAQTAEQIAGGELQLEAEVEQEDEIGALANSFNAMTARLRQTLAGLEQQVAERTAALGLRTAYLQASVDVSRAVVSILDPEQLIQQVVDLIRERFSLYYVGLFLVDEAGEWAVLRAGTGEAGRAMLARGHRIKVGSGMIGWCIAHERPRIALRAEMDEARLRNPDLPHTRSEAAIPLRSRGRVLGALTIQSDQPDAFDEAILAVFETMADQVAVALDNARLFRESQEALDSLNRAYGQITRQEWLRLLQRQGDIGYCSYASGEIAPETGWQPDLERAFLEGQTVLSQDSTGVSLGVPIKVRDTVIGVIAGYKTEQQAAWTEAEKNFLQDVADTIGLALESARSYQQVQLTARRERLSSEITGRMRRSLEMETILRTAAEEVRKALELPEVTIQLGVPTGLSSFGQGLGEDKKSNNE